MNISYSIKKILKSHIVSFIFSIILVSFCSVCFINLKTKPKDVERLSLFIAADVNERKALQDHICDIVPELYEVKIYSISENDSYFGTYASAYADSSDLIILSKNKLDALEDLSSFVNATNLNINSNSSIYKECAISLTNCNSLLDSHISYLQDEYYLLINSKSVHLNGIIDNSSTDYLKRILSDFNILNGGETI